MNRQLLMNIPQTFSRKFTQPQLSNILCLLFSYFLTLRFFPCVFRIMYVVRRFVCIVVRHNVHHLAFVDLSKLHNSEAIKSFYFSFLVSFPLIVFDCPESSKRETSLVC